MGFMNRTILAITLVLTPVLMMSVERAPPPPPAAASIGCGGMSPVVKDVTNVVVKKLLAECVAENAHLGDIELQDACKFADDVWPVIRDLIAAQRRGMAKMAKAGTCVVKDAGRD